MKKNLYLLVLLCGIVVSVSAQINLQDSLLVHFTLDGNAQDQSGKNNHGNVTATGVYATQNYIGQEHKAMLFNGKFEQGMISLPLGFIDTMSAITIGGWVKPLEFVSGGQGFFGQDNVLEITAYSGPNRLRVYHPTSGTVDVNLTAGANVWYHVLVTCNTEGMKIYVNGIESASRTGNYKLVSSAFSTNLGGKVISQSSNYYYGMIDDFRIYNRVLTNDEINFLAGSFSLTYNINSLAKTTFCTGESLEVSYTILGDNIANTNTFYLQLSDANGSFANPIIIGSVTGNSSGSISAQIPDNLPLGSGYKMRLVSTLPYYIGTASSQTFTINNPSEGVSTLSRGKILELLFDGNYNDNSSTQRHGTAVGGVSFVDDRHGNPLKAIQLNGTNGHIVLPEGVWFDGTAFSASVWLKPGSYNNWSRIFDFSNGAGSDNVNLSISDGTTGRIHLGWRQGSTSICAFSGDKRATLNQWNHVAAVYDGTTAYIYVNGELSAQSTVAGPRLLHRTLGYIGRSPWTTNDYANAAYDDFILWDRALTLEEIKLLANDGTIITNSPVCAGSTLHIEAPAIEGAIYNWSGPNGFTSTQRVNYIDSAHANHIGTYKVTITLGECSYTDSISNVNVITPGAQTATSFTGLPAYSHLGASNATLTGTPTGGYFTGSGMDINIFKPANAGVGSHGIYYHYYNTNPGCYTTGKQIVDVYPTGVINLGEEISCSGYFYDSGGSGGNYGNDETIIKTFTSANGEMLEFTFTNRAISVNDTLYAFDGPTVNNRILVAYTSGSRWEGFTSSGPSVTFKFVSNASGTNTGWTAQYNCTSTPQQSKNYSISNSIVSVCTGKFYDDGGPSGNHGDVGSYTQTFYSRTGDRIKFNFTAFNTHGGSDIVRVYDGPNTSYPQLISRAGSHGAFSVESTQDVLTITFSMFQNGLTSSGWAADISCTAPPLPAINLIDTAITICSAIIYDHAGPAANYAANRNDTMVIKSSTNQRIQLVFNHNETGIGAGDTLFVFDGDNVNTPIIAKFISGSRLDNIVSSGAALTFVFKSDGATQGKGFMATLNCFDEPAPPVNINLSRGERGLCSGIVRDPGGTGNYSVGTNTTQVFRSLDGNRLKLHFSELAINGNNDGHWLHIYDGPDNTYPRIGSYNQWAWPPNSIVESTGEYMTLNFNSTNTAAGAGAGFTAEFSCTTPPLEVIPMTKGTFDICDVVIADNGGITANYTANANDTTTLCSANGQLLQVVFNHNETGIAAGDTLWIFDGANVNSPQLGRYITGSRIETITSTGTCLTFVFKSDGANQSRGWQGIVSCISTPPAKVSYNMSSGERNICSGTFYDNGGGSGNYSRGTWTQTFTSYSEQRIRATRTSFSVNGNNGGHWFTVYDGPSTSSPKIGDYNNFTSVPTVFQSTGSSLTFHFNSTNTAAGLSAGWSFDMSCFSGEPIDADWIESPICAGSTISIPYILNESVNEGNQFRAQLSDANGNFTSPVTIGTITDTASGTITATIPGGTASGNNYRIRVISTNPAMIGAASPNPIMIYALPTTPTVSVSGNLEICYGIGSVTLHTTSQIGVNYRWIKDGVQTVGANQNTYTASTAGVYTVEVSNTCDTIVSSNSRTVIVTNSAIAPTISLSGTTDICSNEQVTLSVIKDSSCTYQWYKNDATTGSNDTSLTVSSAGAYTVKLTNVCGIVWAIDTIDVTIKGIPPVTPTISNTTSLSFCEGDSVVLSITPQAGVNYQWILNDTINIGDNAEILIAKNAGTYTVEVSNVCGTEISDNAKTVVVNYKPTIPVITSGNTSICYGDSITLSITEQPDATYQWKKDGENIGENTTSIIVKESGIYSVDVTNNCGTTSASETKTITVFDLPVKPILSDNGKSAICPYETTTLTTTDNGESISWYFNNGFISGKTENTLTVSQAGTYKARLMNINNCFIYSDEVQITSLAAPTAAITSNQTAFCQGAENSITLTANEDANATYQWIKDGVLLDVFESSYSTSTIGSYKAIVSYTNGCLDTSNVITLINSETPIAHITSAGNTVCSGSSLTITAEVVTGATYTWYKNTELVKTGASNTLSVNSEDTYLVEVTNAQGCLATSNSINIIVLPLPEATISSSSTSFCSGGSVQLTAKVLEGALYEWFRNGVSLGIPSLAVNEYHATLSGMYMVAIQKECVASSQSIVITESVLPGNAGVISGNSTFCAGNTLQLSIPALTHAQGYIWEVSPIHAASIVSGQGTRSIVLNTRNQNVTLTVTPYNNCGTGVPSTKTISVDNSIMCTGFSILYSAYPSHVSIGTPITFVNHTSSMAYPDAAPRWNFGSGASPATAIGNGPHTVTYSTAGAKTITIDYVSNFGGFVIASETKTNYIMISSESVTTSSISGNMSLLDCNIQEVYSVVPSHGSMYHWTVPSGAILLSGQGTHQITVRFNGNAGVISVIETNASSVTGASKEILVSCSGAQTLTEDVSKQMHFSIYPNPVKHTLSITSPYTIEYNYYTIFDVSGNAIVSGIFKESHTIPFSEYSLGTYFIQFNNKESIMFIKQ